MLQKQNTTTNGATIHCTEVDICACVDRRIAAIGRELAEIGSNLDPERIFQLEALGYLVDVHTGEIIGRLAEA